jgi:hypothetical protein
MEDVDLNSKDPADILALALAGNYGEPPETPG